MRALWPSKRSAKESKLSCFSFHLGRPILQNIDSLESWCGNVLCCGMLPTNMEMPGCWPLRWSRCISTRLIPPSGPARPAYLLCRLLWVWNVHPSFCGSCVHSVCGVRRKIVDSGRVRGSRFDSQRGPILCGHAPIMSVTDQWELCVEIKFPHE